MFSAVRKRVTYANVAMTLALVFAMTGGAYAAKRYLITSTKQISPKVLKQLKGKPGPAGPQGPAGATGKDGAPGQAGEKGVNGTSGSNGKSVIAAAEPSGANCKEGGSSFEVEGSKAKTYACNGAEGKTGPQGEPGPFTKVLPKGETETGMWTAPASSQPGVYATISFTFQLETPLDNEHVQYVTVEDVAKAEYPEGCAGNVEEPKAEAGYLCVFESNQSHGVEVHIIKPKAKLELGTGLAGCVLYVIFNEEGAEAVGSWALTAA